MSAGSRKRHSTKPKTRYSGTSQCLSKFTFATKVAADASLTYNNSGVIRSYRCNICRKWHMTSLPLRMQEQS